MLNPNHCEPEPEDDEHDEYLDERCEPAYSVKIDGITVPPETRNSTINSSVADSAHGRREPGGPMARFSIRIMRFNAMGPCMVAGDRTTVNIQAARGVCGVHSKWRCGGF
jgi:hypothetical protein